MVKTIKDYMETIKEESQRERVTNLINWIEKTFETLKLEVKWNQPMFTDHGTYIIGMSVSKNHLAIGVEARTMERLVEIIEGSEYEHSKMLIKIKWSQAIDYEFLSLIINDIIRDKESVNSFWY
jgi:uncharacterized protein YdhG (YjbR/CyaY superfamily)